jgi:hypothetical protein
MNEVVKFKSCFLTLSCCCCCCCCCCLVLARVDDRTCVTYGTLVIARRCHIRLGGIECGGVCNRVVVHHKHRPNPPCATASTSATKHANILIERYCTGCAPCFGSNAICYTFRARRSRLHCIGSIRSVYQSQQVRCCASSNPLACCSLAGRHCDAIEYWWSRHERVERR